MIKRCGLYDSNGNVVNVIVIDTEVEYTPSEGLSIIGDESAAIGDTVEDGALASAPLPEPEEEPGE